MSLQQQQEEFRQYLDEVGILKIIYQGLKAIYSQNPEDRPKDALQFFMGQMNLDVTENPHATEIEDLKRQAQDWQRKYEELKVQYDTLVGTGALSKASSPDAKTDGDAEDSSDAKDGS